MKNAIYFLLLVLLVACKKHSDQDVNTCPDYVPGDLVVGIASSATLEDAFFIFTAYGLSIEQADGFLYTSPYPADSAASLAAYLDTKPYIHAHGFGVGSGNVFVHYQTRVLQVALTYWDMNGVNQHDWTVTHRALQLTRVASPFQYLVLRVPAGQELQWLKKVRTNTITTWAELNCRNQMRPF